jgi:hypothetical protein
MDAVSVAAVGAVVGIGGPAARDGLARYLPRLGHNGATLGMHARRAQTLQHVHSQCRSDNYLSQREER